MDFLDLFLVIWGLALSALYAIRAFSHEEPLWLLIACFCSGLTLWYVI